MYDITEKSLDNMSRDELTMTAHLNAIGVYKEEDGVDELKTNANSIIAYNVYLQLTKENPGISLEECRKRLAPRKKIPLSINNHKIDLKAINMAFEKKFQEKLIKLEMNP